MTKDEAARRYQIPAGVLDEYERWGLCGSVKQVMGKRRYDDTDLERLSLIMALHDTGFAPSEVERYMRLLLSDEDTAAQRMRMLESRRKLTLDEIHLREKQLARMDDLRHKIRAAQQDAQGGKR